MMRDVIGDFFGIVVTPWKLVGFLGALMFAGRWLVQAWATRRAGRPMIPRSFWIISLVGSAMVTSYFIWGKNDAVGVLTNLLPASVAFYNLIMDIRHQPRRSQCLTSVLLQGARAAAPSASPHLQCLTANDDRRATRERVAAASRHAGQARLPSGSPLPPRPPSAVALPALRNGRR